MKLGLGTVQFGLDYGISNHQGKTSLGEAANILQVAKSSGIDLLDTASLYGDSEVVLGQTMQGKTFQIVTKTPQFKTAKIKKEHAAQLKQAFISSINNLHVNSIYGLLMHHAEDLLAVGGEYLMDALIELKMAGGVQKIGISVYKQAQIEAILAKYKIDLIQLPINVLDQRLTSAGMLKSLKLAGIEIHVRSIFLQGLLLMKTESLDSHFDALKPQLLKYHHQLIDYGLSPLQGALAYANSIIEIDYAVVGVTTSEELIQISDAFNSLPKKLPDWAQFACNDERIINPAMWN